MRAIRWLLALLVTSAGCSLVIDGEVISVHCDDEDAFGPPACPVSQRCVEHTCVGGTAAQAKLGSRCSEDSDCAAGDFCLDPVNFGGDGVKVCSRPCCDSSSCTTAGFVCWAPPDGGGYFCRDATRLERPVGGTNGPGTSCKVGGDCRSGLCTAGQCDDPCCGGGNCANHGQCRFDETSSGFGLACEKPVTGRDLLAACETDGQCASGLCLEVEGKRHCVMACCTSNDCGALGSDNLVCDYFPHAGTLVRACGRIAPKTGSGLPEDPCQHDSDCRSAQCVKDDAGESRCQDVCCLSQNCGLDTHFACLPRPGGSEIEHASVLRCERK